MIKSIRFVQYKKLKNISLDFKEGLNVISGENGTCKSSLLYLISNAFQAVTPRCDWLNGDKRILKTLKAVNSVMNPKIESLQRKEYSNPAPEVQGSLYTVCYFSHGDLEFRRHNSKDSDKNRYALKPYYKGNSGDSLPCCPVVYLGLSRLIPYGEYTNDAAVTSVKKNLPPDLVLNVARNYKLFTGYEIEHEAIQNIGNLKRRAVFSSNQEGIDSNTISAGEDNLYIILAALESLKYYFESISSGRRIESVLLIDEFDATLHPDYQVKLLKIMREYSYKYRIQIFFTTHSITTIEDVLTNRDNYIYLVNNLTHVVPMEAPTIHQIKAHLYNKTFEDIYSDKCIPVLTEDAEARFLINLLFDYFEEQEKTNSFCKVRRFFQMPEINLGSDQLFKLFSDEKLINSRVGAICIIDGDHYSDITNCIMTLPGRNAFSSSSGLSPENLLFEYSKHLYDIDDSFWDHQTIIKEGFSKNYFLHNILRRLEQYEEAKENETTSQKRRDFNKELFNGNITFFKYVFRRWLRDDDNRESVGRFYGDLRRLFLKCAEIRGINSLEWK